MMKDQTDATEKALVELVELLSEVLLSHPVAFLTPSFSHEFRHHLSLRNPSSSPIIKRISLITTALEQAQNLGGSKGERRAK
jgi:hypothetical protein